MLLFGYVSDIWWICSFGYIHKCIPCFSVCFLGLFISSASPLSAFHCKHSVPHTVLIRYKDWTYKKSLKSLQNSGCGRDETEKQNAVLHFFPPPNKRVMRKASHILLFACFPRMDIFLFMSDVFPRHVSSFRGHGRYSQHYSVAQQVGDCNNLKKCLFFLHKGELGALFLRAVNAALGIMNSGKERLTHGVIWLL